MSADSSGASAPVLRVEGLVKHFPVAHSRAFVAAVNGVSFEIARGETLGLVGESGSGKSTVARCIMNLESPTAGMILFDGREISGVPAKEARLLRRQVQLVFQEPFDSLNPRMPIRSIVAEPLRVRNVEKEERRRRVGELLDLVHLPSSVLDLYRTRSPVGCSSASASHGRSRPIRVCSSSTSRPRRLTHARGGRSLTSWSSYRASSR